MLSVWQKWKEKSGKRLNLSLKLNEQQWMALKEAARLEHTTPKQWLLNVLTSQIPYRLSQKMTAVEKARAEIEIVFNELEKQEREAEPETTLHPCGFLDPHPPLNWKFACEGVCRHPDNKGKVCLWSAERAPECAIFRRHERDNAPSDPTFVIIRR